MRRIIFAVATLVIIGGTLGTGYYFSGRQRASERPANEEVVALLTQKYPTFTYKNKPVIEVVDLKRYEQEWYVVTIKSTRDLEEYIPVKLVIKKTDDNLQVISSPDITFSESEMLSLNVPDSVILELKRS